MTDYHRRMVTAWREALEASHHSSFVTIHIGSDICEWMKKQANIPNDSPPRWENGVVGTFAGFPVVQEPSWATEQIEVHTRKVIA